MELKYVAATDDDSEDDNKSTVFQSINDRMIYLYGDVNARNCADIAYDILAINLDDNKNEERERNFSREPIRIYINSFGGNVYNMWMVIDTILCSKTPVYTYCHGYAMSAAFLIFLAGHKRYVSSHATLMYHQIYCWRSGKYQDLVEDRRHMDHQNRQIEKFVTESTCITQEYLDSIREKKRDTYFCADEAIELGIATDFVGEET